MPEMEPSGAYICACSTDARLYREGTSRGYQEGALKEHGIEEPLQLTAGGRCYVKALP